MITKFKLFENINEGEVQVGDYILHKSRIDDFLYLSTTIGQILTINGYREARVRFDHL